MRRAAFALAFLAARLVADPYFFVSAAKPLPEQSANVTFRCAGI
jgi:hypothetical protein